LSLPAGIAPVVALLALAAGCGEDRDALEDALLEARRSPIAFVSDRDGVRRIYVMDEDGSRQRPLSDPPQGGDAHPAWSPDGKQIAFVSYRDHAAYGEIYVMDADGENERNITNSPDSHDTHPAWSPDGSSIAFASDRDYGPRTLDIYVMDADGSAPRHLLGEAAVDAMYPAWTPDGARMLYVAASLANPDGGSYRVLVNDMDGTPSRRAWGVNAADPRTSLSPDATTVATVGERLPPSYHRGRSLYAHVLTIQWERALTDDPQVDDEYPSWSPGGSRIVYMSKYLDDDGEPTGRVDIRVVDVDTLAVTQLTDIDGYDGMPAWAPFR